MSLPMIETKDRSERAGDRERLKQIIGVLEAHEIQKGITPEKLCAIIVDLGPTFIKLGQILSMRSDILPKAYCEALTSLQSDVAPMPFDEVTEIVERAFGRPMDELFESFS